MFDILDSSASQNSVLFCLFKKCCNIISACWYGYVDLFRWDVLMAFLCSKTEMILNSLGQMWQRELLSHLHQLVLSDHFTSFIEVVLTFFSFFIWVAVVN